MKSLPIVWQRLVSPDGQTCDRCSATYQEMQQAVSKLKEALRPLSRRGWSAAKIPCWQRHWKRARR
jgi:anti-sigma factor RsiW